MIKERVEGEKDIIMALCVTGKVMGPDDVEFSKIETYVRPDLNLNVAEAFNVLQTLRYHATKWELILRQRLGPDYHKVRKQLGLGLPEKP